MPRYCAVKLCRNRGGAASKQEDKRISFYPFPLQDKPRLQKWVHNMKREEWTPSRHQYLCSEHFTEDCFDIRWGIRYLKNTAIPTTFPSTEDVSIRLSINEHPLVPDTGTSCTSNLSEVQAAVCLIPKDGGNSTVSCLAVSLCNESHFEQQTDSTVTVLCCETLGPLPNGEANMDTAALQAALGQTFSFVPVEMVKEEPAECLSEERGPVEQCRFGNESHFEQQTDSTVTVLCCETLGPLPNGEANMDTAALQAALGQTFSFVPVEMVKEEPAECLSEERGPVEGEHISLYEHAYCRPDTDKDQLWSRIMSLNARF
uniref:THAP-type domain-containing protein n=1 Tax=Labrus bergylta TaxID=56723 RepID=A0A3Q3EIW0_9LABR